MGDSAAAPSAVGSSHPHKSHSLFQVYLRLRPPPAGAPSNERFITVEPPAAGAPSTAPTHINLSPPTERRRPIEKFAFTHVFDEDATQLDVFHCTNVVSLVEGVLAPHGREGTDALLATLGVTGSGKSHTVLGSRSQRGLTQLALDLLFCSVSENMVDADASPTIAASVKSCDASEASLESASAFIEAVYGDPPGQALPPSRAQTPQPVRKRDFSSSVDVSDSETLYPELPSLGEELVPRFSTPKSVRIVLKEDYTVSSPCTPEQLRRGLPASSHGGAAPTTGGRRPLQAKAGQLKTPGRSPSRHYMSVTASTQQRKRSAKTPFSKGDQIVPPTPRRLLARPSALPQVPDVSTVNVPCDPAAEYVVLVSMYEVYNNQIFDLLTPPVKSAANKESRRRPLPFKPTELSPDRKVVAGLRKIMCSNLNQALLVLEAGLHERRVAGTVSNSVSSRSHGFFCIEVKKRKRSSSKRYQYPWGGNVLTIVDLAGSERARDAKTAGATLAEAGKINESLMYLGQCLQMQSDSGNSKSTVAPFRQCKLTELLFSNSFPSSSSFNQSQTGRRIPQKGIMIVTADACGDYNATSQILRYSALAREVTVPRIPSIAETILQVNTAVPSASVPSSCGTSSPISSLTHQPQRPPFLHPVRSFSPTSTMSWEDRMTMEHAALEIARVSEEARYLRETLSREHEARLAAEAHLLSMEDRMLEFEQAVREDCVEELEKRLAVEHARWNAGMQMATERGQEHWDRKMEVYERSLAAQPVVREDADGGGGAGCDNKENLLFESLEEENARLRREVTILQRELAGRSPSKRMPLAERDDLTTSAHGSPLSTRNKNDENIQSEILHRRIESLTLHVGGDERKNLRKGGGSADTSRASSKSRADGTGTPAKRIRKLTARKWEGGLGVEDDPF